MYNPFASSCDIDRSIHIRVDTITAFNTRKICTMSVVLVFASAPIAYLTGECGMNRDCTHASVIGFVLYHLSELIEVPADRGEIVQILHHDHGEMVLLGDVDYLS